MSHLPDGFVEHRGCRIAYDVRGAGPPLLLIQGVGVHGRGWTPQTDALANHHTCLTFDNRGVGQSRPAGGPITVEQMADDARAVMDAVGWESAHVAGHSLGGLVAISLALADPRRVRSLSLLCTFARGKDAAPLTPRMVWLGLRTKVGTRAMRRRAFLRLVSPPGHTTTDGEADRMADLFGHDLVNLPEAAGMQLRAMRAADTMHRLGELAGIPTLVVNAEHDPIAPPRLGRALAAGIAGAKYVELAGASHAALVLSADRVNALLAEHLAASGRASDS
jgi:pimeloyl-ACP methyl ester carboxylesterase